MATGTANVIPTVIPNVMPNVMMINNEEYLVGPANDSPLTLIALKNVITAICTSDYFIETLPDETNVEPVGCFHIKPTTPEKAFWDYYLVNVTATHPDGTQSTILCNYLSILGAPVIIFTIFPVEITLATFVYGPPSGESHPSGEPPSAGSVC